MIKLFSTLIVMITVFSAKASDAKVSEDIYSRYANVQIDQTYQPDNTTLITETLSVLFPNQNYVSVVRHVEPEPDQSPYSGTYSVHDSICLYRLQAHQAEQYYNHLKQMIEQDLKQQKATPQKKRAHKEIPFHMALRSRTRNR